MIANYAIELIERSLGDFKEMGGPGSGHHGHKGRKGKKGGSLPRGAPSWTTSKGLEVFNIKGGERLSTTVVTSLEEEGPVAIVYDIGKNEWHISSKSIDSTMHVDFQKEVLGDKLKGKTGTERGELLDTELVRGVLDINGGMVDVYNMEQEIIYAYGSDPLKARRLGNRARYGREKAVRNMFLVGEELEVGTFREDGTWIEGSLARQDVVGIAKV